MIGVLMNFFGVIGLDIAAPSTMGELIPYFFSVVIGLGIVHYIFELFKYWATVIFRGRIV